MGAPLHWQQVGGGGGEGDLSTSLVQDTVAVTVVIQHVRSLHTQLGLQRARCVVYPGMDNPAVVTGLVYGCRKVSELA